MSKEIKEVDSKDEEQRARIKEIFDRIEIINNEKIIKGSVDLSFLELTELPDLSDISIKDGSFDIANNKLTSFKGSPKSVDWHVYADNNEIADLCGAPAHIGSFFSCEYNNLTTLENCPQDIKGSLFFRNNALVSIRGVPEIDYGNFTADNISHDDYKKYIEDTKLLKTVDSETASLFANLITTI